MSQVARTTFHVMFHAVGRRMAAPAAVLIAVAAAVLVPAAPASANQLVSSWPAAGERLSHSPRQIRLSFADRVVGPATVSVTGPSGRVDQQAAAVHGTNVTQGLVTGLPDAAYTVSWQVGSDSGSFRFAVGAAALPAVPAAPAPSAPRASATPASAPRIIRPHSRPAATPAPTRRAIGTPATADPAPTGAQPLAEPAAGPVPSPAVQAIDAASSHHLPPPPFWWVLLIVVATAVYGLNRWRNGRRNGSGNRSRSSGPPRQREPAPPVEDVQLPVLLGGPGRDGEVPEPTVPARDDRR